MSYTDYPQAASDNARRALEYIEENNVDCATRVGKARANQLKDREPLTFDTVKRTYSYLSRAEEYDTGDYADGCGSVSYDLWGGEPMLPWCEKIIEQEEETQNMHITDSLKAKVRVQNNKEIEIFAIGQVGAKEDMMDSRSIITMLKYAEEMRQEEGDMDIVMNIYSEGGTLVDALAVYDYVKSKGIKFTAKGYGMVGSAATVIMCASAQAMLGENSVYFIHNAYYTVPEEYITAEMNESLNERNKATVNIYQAKCGDKVTRGQLKKLMRAGDKNKDLTAKEAKTYGFVDKVMRTNNASTHMRKLVAQYKQEHDKSNTNKPQSNIMTLTDIKAALQDLIKGKRVSEEKAEEIANKHIEQMKAELASFDIDPIEHQGLKAKLAETQTKAQALETQLQELKAEKEQATAVATKAVEQVEEQAKEQKEVLASIETLNEKLEAAQKQLAEMKAERAFSKPATQGNDAQKTIAKDEKQEQATVSNSISSSDIMAAWKSKATVSTRKQH